MFHLALDRRLPGVHGDPPGISPYYSFTNYNGLGISDWVGARNYVQIFTKDPYIRTALSNTLYLAFFGVVFGSALALILALLLNQKIRGIGVYRTLYYLPTMLPIVVSAFVFSLVLDPNTGVVNKVLAGSVSADRVGCSPPPGPSRESSSSACGASATP